MDGWRPWAEYVGDPHLHRCGCGHEWVAPLKPGSNTPCPGCTDADGHNYLDRAAIRMARASIDKYGLDVIMITDEHKQERQRP